jgi:FkbM family methyltransferase
MPVIDAVVPVELALAGSESASAAREVLAGEYDAPYDGEGLRILDLGANLGAFSVWAERRWPHSTITAYEPEPGAFALLERNTGARVRCVNAAVYPSDAATMTFVRRAGADIEAAVTTEAGAFLAELPPDQLIEVATVHPRDLPAADVVKLDVEGAEAVILAALDLSEAALITLEYHDRARRDAIERLTAGEFDVVRRTAHPWAPYLRGDRYRPRSSEDEYGVLVLVRRGQTRLRRSDAHRLAAVTPAVGLREAVAPVPRLALAAARRRLRRALHQ